MHVLQSMFVGRFILKRKWQIKKFVSTLFLFMFHEKNSYKSTLNFLHRNQKRITQYSFDSQQKIFI